MKIQKPCSNPNCEYGKEDNVLGHPEEGSHNCPTCLGKGTIELEEEKSLFQIYKDGYRSYFREEPPSIINELSHNSHWAGLEAIAQAVVERDGNRGHKFQKEKELSKALYAALLEVYTVLNTDGRFPNACPEIAKVISIYEAVRKNEK